MNSKTKTTKTTRKEELERLRERLEGREARAEVRAGVRSQRIRRRARIAGQMARTRAEVAEAGEARALRAASTSTVALAVLLPVLGMFAAWSAAGVQAGMVRLLDLDPDSAAAWAAWLVEPALIGVVAGIIILRARLRSLDADLPEGAGRIEAAALLTSIGLNLAGHWPEELSGGAVAAMAGHALGPLGAAGTAMLISLVQRGVADVDPWHRRVGGRWVPVPSLAEVEARNRAAEQAAGGGQEESEGQEEAAPPRPSGWVEVPAGARVLPLVARPRPAAEDLLDGDEEDGVAVIREALRDVIRQELDAAPEPPSHPGGGADGAWTLEAVSEAAAAEGIGAIEDYLDRMGRLRDGSGDTPSPEPSRGAPGPSPQALEPGSEAAGDGGGQAEKIGPDQQDGTGRDAEADLLERARAEMAAEPSLSAARLGERIGCSKSHAHRLQRQLREETRQGTARDAASRRRPTEGGEGDV
ncbi:MAG TPA: hypothetical protein VKZ89_05815 [Thermobifida alba]|nr:hypothetical protein [Thermobifida alba]